MTLLVVAAVLAILIGLSLGMLGGGGSILTLPILVYVLGVDPKTAIASSLFVVGTTSVVSLIPHGLAKRVRYKTGVVFAIPAMVFAWIAAKWIAPHIDARILMGAFAVLMLVTAVNMIRGRKNAVESTSKPLPYLLGIGALAGFIAGMVGAGGGFIVVPALALVAGLPMAEAVATSLIVIALQSSVAFLGAVGSLVVPISWPLISVVAVSAVIGSLIGARLVPYIKPGTLRKVFGVFVLVMGVFQLGASVLAR
jgi:hypothetical protein